MLAEIGSFLYILVTFLASLLILSAAAVLVYLEAKGYFEEVKSGRSEDDDNWPTDQTV
jgi:hypothetical protein